MLVVKKRSPVTGRYNTMDIPLATEEFHHAYDSFKLGTRLEHAFPTLTTEEREFISTGMTPHDKELSRERFVEVFS